MRLEEMVQDMHQGPHVLAVPARLRRAHIIHDHVADPLGPMLLVEEVFGKCAGGGLRHVLMLGDGQHLLLGQATERDAVFQGDHDASCRVFKGV
jgi:hypothetical protein